MKNVFKHISVILFLFMIVLFKTDASAEAIWNTTGEKSPTGSDWTYKYWNGTDWVYTWTSAGVPNTIDITYDVTYCYEEAYKIHELVNEQRRLAGVPEVQMKDELMDVAMKRAAETALRWVHERPNGEPIYTNMFIDGENIYNGLKSASSANDAWVNSPGHYATMVNSAYDYVGYGCVIVNGGCYWVQVFSGDFKYYEDGYDSKWHLANDYFEGNERISVPSPNDKPVKWDELTVGKRKDYTEMFTTQVCLEYINIKATSRSYMLEGTTTLLNVGVSCMNERKQVNTFIPLTEDKYTTEILTPELCSIVDGKITALKEGTAKVKFTLKADTSKTTVMEVEIQGKPIQNGESYSVGDTSYKMISKSSKTVEFEQTSSEKTSISIPNTVEIKGKKYKVTSIADNAFKGNTNVKTITIGSNVKKIGKNAFYGCKKLKSIKVKSKKLTSVGKNALKGIHKKAVVKVPKSKLSKYKKLFKNKGQKKTVKIKK